MEMNDLFVNHLKVHRQDLVLLDKVANFHECSDTFYHAIWDMPLDGGDVDLQMCCLWHASIRKSTMHLHQSLGVITGPLLVLLAF